MAVSSATSATGSTSTNRITGLATGMDTDAMVKALMISDQTSLDKLNQQKQVAQWTQDSYRDITTTLKGFQDSSFNILNPAGNMTSSTTFFKYNTTTSDSSVVTASGAPGITSLNHSITVNQIATTSTANSTGAVSKPLVGDAVANFTVDSKNNSFTINYNGTTKTITLPNGTYADANAILGDGTDGLLKQQVKQAFNNNVDVVVNGNGLQLTSPNASDTFVLSSPGTSKVLTNLGFSIGTSNKLSLDDSMATVSSKFANGAIAFDSNNQFKLTVNGTDVIGNSTDTLYTFMNKVNTSGAGVTMTYSSYNDTFSLNSKQTGSASITLNDNGSNFVADTNLTSVKAGTDASFSIDGVVGTRSNNSFLVDGVTYNLQKADPGVAKNVALTQDVDTVFNSVKSFIDKYNSTLDALNAKLSEDYDSNYKPLTDAQKAAMSADDITKWETKAKTGLLKNDDILDRVVNNMRQAVYSPTNGISGNLASIGITTGTYEEKGKLIIDEAKLRDAIKTSPDLVSNLFTKQSTTAYKPDLNATDRATRFNENGIMQRLSDVLQDNVRTTRNASGKKGTLVEKAGVVGDLSEISNTIYTQIKGYNVDISNLTTQMTDKQTMYYQKFAAMEQAISKMNSQSSWLSSQMGGSSAG